MLVLWWVYFVGYRFVFGGVFYFISVLDRVVGGMIYVEKYVLVYGVEWRVY